MYSSLHLSELEPSRNILKSRTSDQQNSVSQFLEMDSYRTQLSLIRKKSTKVRLYETKIGNFERKLKEEKRKTTFSMKEALDRLREEENKIEKQFFELQQSQKTIKQQKVQSDKQISEQKLILLELEDESKRLEKSNEWANSTFSFKKSSNSITDSVLQMESQLSMVKMHIKDLRSKIFHYQKELLRISESLSPVRSQQYMLRSRIDEALNNSYTDSSVKAEFHQSFMLSVNEQLLSLTKFRTENNIKSLLEKINQIQDEKHQVMQKLLSLRSSVNDSLLHSIQDQALQYREASERRRKLELERQNSSHMAISKELDIRIERDSISENKKEIQKQKEEVEKNLKEKKEQIEKLEKIIAIDAEIATSGPEVILDELITKIQRARLDSLKLRHICSQYTQKGKENNENKIEFDESEFDEERNNIDQKIKTILSSLAENDSEMKQLNIQVKKESDSLSQISESISLIETSKPIIKTPKIILLTDLIEDIQENINKLKKKKEKKKKKISSLNENLQSLVIKLDLRRTRNFFKIDATERIERSMRWLFQMTKNNVKKWRETGSLTMSTLNEWDTKVLLAALNEAEDLYVRYSLICS